MHKTLAQTIAAQFTELRSAPDEDGSQVAGGPSLSTTLKTLSIPIGADWISITPRNLAGGANVARVALNPRLTILVTTNQLATGQQTTPQEPISIADRATQNISDEMQDGDTEDFAIDLIDTAANDNFIYVGSPLPFGGVAMRFNNLNDVASVLTVNYLSGTDPTWTDISDTDGTDVAGDTFKQNGNVTWTVPTDWLRASLGGVGETAVREPWSTQSLYWTRWEFSVALDTVDLVQMRSLTRNTAYLELLTGQPLEFSINPRVTATVEALTDAGTANLIINAAVLAKSSTGLREEFRA